jgi:hypothetical protein
MSEVGCPQAAPLQKGLTMSTVTVGNYEVALSKVSNGEPKEDEQIRRNVGRTETFSLEGHFTKVSAGPKVYFKMDIGGGVGSTVVGRWVDLENVGDKVTKLFYSGDVEYSQKSKEVQVKLLVDDNVVRTWSFELV